MLLVLGALVLFSTIAVTVNHVLLDSEQVATQTQAGMVAVTTGQGLLDRAAATPFDSLGIGFDVAVVNTAFSAFLCTTRVNYVQATAPEVTVTGPTPLKRIAVTMASPFLAEPVVLRTIIGRY